MTQRPASLLLDHVYRLKRGCSHAGLQVHSYGFIEVMAQQEKVCGIPLWSSALITLPHNRSSPLTTIRPRAGPDVEQNMSENRVRSCLWLLEIHETINQVVLIALMPGVGGETALRHMDLLQLRWMLVSTDIQRLKMILLLTGRQTSAMKWVKCSSGAAHLLTNTKMT